MKEGGEARIIRSGSRINFDDVFYCLQVLWQSGCKTIILFSRSRLNIEKPIPTIFLSCFTSSNIALNIGVPFNNSI